MGLLSHLCLKIQIVIEIYVGIFSLYKRLFLNGLFLAHSDFVKPRSKLFGWILFAAGVWTFSKGGVEGEGEIDLFFLHCLGHMQRRIVIFFKDILGRLYIVRDMKKTIILKVVATLLNKHKFCLDFLWIGFCQEWSIGMQKCWSNYFA